MAKCNSPISLTKKPWYRNKVRLKKLLILITILATVLASIYGLLYLVSERFQPFTIWSLWETKGSFLDWSVSCYPIMLWAVIFCYLRKTISPSTTIKKKAIEWNSKRKHFLADHQIYWLWIPILEEIIHRWMLFLLLIPTLQGIDYIFSGYLHSGYLNGLAPICNLVSLDYLSDWINHPQWTIGAALIVSNLLFAAQHCYQGWLGVVNSWFLGLAFFWLTLNYGIVSAIIAHSFFNFLIFATVYVIYYKDFKATPPREDLIEWVSFEELKMVPIAEQKPINFDIEDVLEPSNVTED